MILGVLGCGSIGKRHIANLLALGLQVVASDPSVQALDEVRKAHGIRTFSSAGAMLKEASPDAVLVCTPTHLHAAHAALALENGCHVFIEKPVSDRLDGLGKLEALARKKRRVAFVACNMRFHPSVMHMKARLESGALGKIYSARLEFGNYLPDWRPGTDYSKTYSAHRAQGGGIILDAVHEFDYLSWLLGEPSDIFCFAGRLGGLKIDVEDAAGVLVRMKSGAIAEAHLDYLQRSKRRSCQFIGSKGTIIWESTGKNPEKSVVREYLSATKRWKVRKESLGAKEANDIYVREVRHFMDCVRGTAKPVSTIAAGRLALEMALAARKSAESGKKIAFK